VDGDRADLFRLAGGVQRRTKHGPSVECLDGVLMYEQNDAGWALLDENNEVVAQLSIDGAPRPVPGRAIFYTEPPVLTDELRLKPRAPEPLPDDVTPAREVRLVGRWVPAEGGFPTDPHAVLKDDGTWVGDDGTWVGSDGCNQAGSRWSVADNGRLLTTAGPSTEMWCEGAPVPLWIGQAQRAALEDRILVLYAQDGSELATLRKA
jgi:hypothetical protein